MFVCCASSLLSSSTAIRQDLTHIGWGEYSAQRGMTIALSTTVFFGIALAGLGLGLQATHRRTPLAAVVLTLLAAIFYGFHGVFFAATLHSWVLTIVCIVLTAGSMTLLGLSVGAVREMRRQPPGEGFEILPKHYVVPYSHMHQDPPEVRIAQELEQRKQRLAVQQKELEMLEEKLKRKLQQKKE